MQTIVLFFIGGAVAALFSIGCFSTAAYLGLKMNKAAPQITMTSAPPGVDLSEWNVGAAFVNGKGMLLWDPNKYELKTVPIQTDQ